MDIKKGESIVFSASTSEIKTNGLASLFQKEVDNRAPRDNFFHCLVNAAHQFHNKKNGSEYYLLSGYPWFKSRARDTFVSLPGLTLCIDEQEYFEKVMHTAEKGYREFVGNMGNAAICKDRGRREMREEIRKVPHRHHALHIERQASVSET